MTDSDPFDPWKSQVEAFGRYLKAQRSVSDLSLRELARLTNLSNAYLSQLERGLHEPSLRVMRSLADALGIPLETLLEQTGWRASGATERAAGATEAAIRADPLLSEAQKEALLAVYGSYVAEARRREGADTG
jgi:transcriptional regulator with XRE-family HTH domain